MECKKCGKVAPENAIFCGNCGTRLDGKIPCKNCGQLNDEDSAYCIFCGTRIDGKRVCTNCGKAHAGNFCPDCGHSAEVKRERKKTAQAEGGKSSFTRICEITQGGLMMLGVLFALIFVCFIGVKTAGYGAESEKRTLFYFFGDYYKELKDLQVSEQGYLEWFENTIERQGALVGAIGTTLSVLIILCVVTFATIAIVKYVRSWLSRTENNANGMALACVLSLFVGIAIFFGYVRECLSDGENAVFVKLTGATTAAIFLCAFACGGGLLCGVFARGKKLLSLENVCMAVFSLVALALGGVVLALAKNTALSFDVRISGGGISEKLSMKSGFLLMSFGSVMGIAEELNDLNFSRYYELTRDLDMLLVFSIISQILLFVFAAFAAVAILTHAGGVRGKKSSGLAWSITLTALSIALLVFTILCSRTFVSVMEYFVVGSIGEDISAAELAKMLDIDGHYGVAIGNVVISVLLLGVSIARAVVAKIFQNKEITE